MDLLRKYIWVLVIVGIIFASAVIILLFLLINKCISRQGKLKMLHLQRRFDNKLESNKYGDRNLDGEIPALPPRTQFLTAEAQSYENLAEGSDGEKSVCDYEEIDEQQVAELLPPPPPYSESNLHPGGPVGQSYENLAEEYEQSTDQQPDYVSVEDETEAPPLDLNGRGPASQSYENLAEEAEPQPDYVSVEDEEHPAEQSSTEDYDDIGEENQDDDEDYDNIGGEEENQDDDEDYDNIGGEEENQDDDEDYDDVI